MTDIQPITQDPRYALPELTTLHPELCRTNTVMVYGTSPVNHNFALIEQAWRGSLTQVGRRHFSVRQPPVGADYRRCENHFVVVQLGEDSRWYVLCDGVFRPAPCPDRCDVLYALHYPSATHFDTLEAAVRSAVKALAP